MPDDPQKVEITGQTAPVQVEVAKGDDPLKPKPTVEKTTETKETVKTIGEPPPPPPPAVVADDGIRRELARELLLYDFGITALCLWLLFFHSALLPTGMLPFVTGLIGTIVGYRAADTKTVVQYDFGSSSGSTAKSALLEKGK
jgi:hypothetical protein